MEEDNQSSKKGRVCVTGGTGFLGSRLILKLLQSGYAVNTTVRPNPDGGRDVSYLTNLPGASERLQIFNADLDKPQSFVPAIQGCIGVFHVAHALDLEGKEEEETKTKRAINGVLTILQACIDSKTVKRFIYTSSASTVVYNGKNLDMVDEDSWTDVGLMRSMGASAGSYVISKTLTEKAAIEFAENHGLDLVTVIPSWIHGPFISSHFPDSVKICLALFFGDQEHYKYIWDTSLVHVDDVARAHIFLFEYPNAKGRYLCSALHVTIHELSKFVSARYPQYQLPINADSLKDVVSAKFSGFSSKKLLETGFKFQHGLEDMYDDAIRCCKEKGFF
ncbi:vestitone reductase-like [Primulina eburnea]|uniref:vestitone reductase-like n=1 Tax=Primulina eburnea TaxID=1245227 RepID=UPI003C6C8D5E